MLKDVNDTSDDAINANPCHSPNDSEKSTSGENGKILTIPPFGSSQFTGLQSKEITSDMKCSLILFG